MGELIEKFLTQYLKFKENEIIIEEYSINNTHINVKYYLILKEFKYWRSLHESNIDIDIWYEFQREYKINEILK